MKRWLTLLFILLTVCSITAPVHADVLFSPVAIAAGLLVTILPWILVAAVVVITWLLLRKYRRRK